MRGSIRKKRDSYEVRVHLGEGRYKSRSFKRKKDAEAFGVKVAGELQEGVYRELKKISFQSFAKTWLETYGPNLRPSTFTLYELMLRRHILPSLGTRPLTQIGADDIQKLLSRKKDVLSPASVHKVRQILVRMFNHGVKWGYLRQNAAKETEPPKIPHKEMKYLEPAEVHRLLSYISEHDHRYLAFFQTALQTGLRIGELVAVKWADVDLRDGVIRVRRQIQQGIVSEPKSKRSIRQVPMPKPVEKTLREHKLATPANEAQWVFASETGNPLNPRNVIRRHFEPALKGAGVKRLRFHDLRHTYAAHLVAAGVHPKAIQEVLGHSSIKTTLDRYGHLMPSAFGEIREGIDKVMGV